VLIAHFNEFDTQNLSNICLIMVKW